ncbi:hypothetical protein [Paenibacillus sp. NPDC058174]|uniref:hypothetical protein n=1 Tax=Paenibacillus sp. NPDC058174 TaxID=3346366 RepID=UPI0036DF6C7A
MDKRKVIHAYRSGYISIQECAQIIGLDSRQIPGLLSGMPAADEKAGKRKIPVTGATS